MLIESGRNAIITLAGGMVQSAPDIMNAIESVLDNAKQAVEQFLPEFLNKGVDAILNMANGLLQGAPNAITNIG